MVHDDDDYVEGTQAHPLIIIIILIIWNDVKWFWSSKLMVNDDHDYGDNADEHFHKCDEEDDCTISDNSDIIPSMAVRSGGGCCGRCGNHLQHNSSTLICNRFRDMCQKEIVQRFSKVLIHHTNPF